MAPTSAPHVGIDIPVGLIAIDEDTGWDTALVQGMPVKVQFDLEARTWRTCPSGETPSLPLPMLSDASSIRRIELPAFPAVSAEARPVPRFVHFIWVGHRAMPEALARRVILNALRTRGWRCIVHVDVDDPQVLASIRARLTAEVPWITVLDLNDEPCVAAFRQHPVHRHYLAFRGEAARNHGAASDLLRLWLVHAYGGIYFDVDDVFADAVDVEAELMAGPGDLLLSGRHSVSRLGFSGYCTSNFASLAGNPLLMLMLDEACRRMDKAPAFFTHRPWPEAGRPESATMRAYTREVFRLTGPQLFTDTLALHRPTTFGLEAALLRAMQLLHYTPDQPRYRADGYLAHAMAAMAHFLPFREGPYRVVIGSAASWNVADQPMS